MCCACWSLRRAASSGSSAAQLLSSWVATGAANERSAERDSSLWRAIAAAVDAFFPQGGGGELQLAVQSVPFDEFKLRVPGVALERQTLGDWRSFRQYAVECRIAPVGGKVDEIVLVAIRIDEAGQGLKRQILAIDRVGDEQRIARRQLDGPEVHEFDEEAVLLEKGSADDLIVVMEIDGCALEGGEGADRHVPLP